MSEHFIQYINIERYKCFSNFSVEGFKRVNLISGKNNVGKTALMEAIHLNVYSMSIPSLIVGLKFLEQLRNRAENSYEAYKPSKVHEKIKNLPYLIDIESNINAISFSCNKTGLIRDYEITANNDSKNISDSDFDVNSIISNSSQQQQNACYLASVRDSQAEIIGSFTAIQKKDRESYVDKLINQFDESIESVKVIGGNSIEFKVKTKEGEFSYRNINEFGDGLRHYISVISDLFIAEDGHIFIDEIDNGIHYSSLDQLWEIVLNLSKELNIQVFATTHSKECIESYCRVAEKLNDRNITFTTLVKNKEKAVKAIVRDYEVFADSIHDEREVRGW